MPACLTVPSSLLSYMQCGRRGATSRIQVKLEGNAPSRAEEKKLKRRGVGVVEALYLCEREREGVCVERREEERRWGQAHCCCHGDYIQMLPQQWEPAGGASQSVA